MIIPQHALENHLKKGCAPVYWIAGQDPYLCNQSIVAIKQAWQTVTQKNSEDNLVDIQQPQDWAESLQDANTYALFSDYRYLELRFGKKTVDATGKQALQTYLDHSNPRTLVLIRAPEVPIKSIQTLANHPQIAVVQVIPYSPPVFKKFIIHRLQALQIRHEPEVPEIIYQYHQANVLACNQFLELLACMHDLSQPLSTTALMTYLRDQSEFSVYELGDACLHGQTHHALHILRQIQQSQGEPILILWVLHQVIRNLAQIDHLLATVSFQAACQQLKIWTQKIPSYQSARQRISAEQTKILLKRCQHIDTQIKTNRSNLLWQDLERLVIDVATG
ncbi:MAG: DNA polymerase III subunit delta [Legionellales bacterium]|nr:DNA polymerase III subunit delta [Legionellales bacterium]